MPYDGIGVRADYCNRTFSGKLENDGQLSHLPIYLGPVGERQPIRRQITQILSHYLTPLSLSSLFPYYPHGGAHFCHQQQFCTSCFTYHVRAMTLSTRCVCTQFTKWTMYQRECNPVSHPNRLTNEGTWSLSQASHQPLESLITTNIKL